MGDLDGKVAIVTGGANGIGRGMVERFAAEGAHVTIADVDAETAQGVADGLGEQVAFKHTDVSDATQVQALVDFTVSTFGGLHVMVNNAGVAGSPRRFLDDDFRVFEKVVAVDLLGVMQGSRCAALHMAKSGGGSIINVASVAGLIPGIGFMPYRAAKAGVVHFTKSIAVELGEHGVRANCLVPGNISTAINAAFDSSAIAAKLQPLQRLGSTEDVAQAALYLASDRSAQVTGIVLPVDGGASAGPPPQFGK
jgi:NAD(P)-dependent dehydrogenase (short-subunit alcohol dehydrogenase family)